MAGNDGKHPGRHIALTLLEVGSTYSAGGDLEEYLTRSRHRIG
jgi:hypothetical protein